MAATIIKSAMCRTRTSVHRPNPTMFYFPGLSAKPWHESDAFPWCTELEESVADIRAEYENLVRTRSLLDNVAKHMVDTPFSFSFFSTLHGGSSIAAHTAPCNLRLRCHLPLIVPSSDARHCGMRVGGEIRPWEEGRCLLFDDCFEHEVWNKTDRERVLLLFDLWHPELVSEEREAITDMFGYAAQQGWLKNDDVGRK